MLKYIYRYEDSEDSRRHVLQNEDFENVLSLIHKLENVDIQVSAGYPEMKKNDNQRSTM